MLHRHAYLLLSLLLAAPIPSWSQEDAPTTVLQDKLRTVGITASEDLAALLPLDIQSDGGVPIHVDADHITGITDQETVAEGRVILKKAENTLTTDRLVYRQRDDEVEATGNVRLSQNDDVITGPHLRLKLTEHLGYFDKPQYSLKRAAASGDPADTTTGSGHAERIDFEGRNHYQLHGATYSTCRADGPEWFARAGRILLDYDQEVGTAHDATLVFKDVPILYSPWLTFSLNNNRKSGLLSPTLGTTSKSGVEIIQPYFWAIAPNLDATIAPRLMTKRGVGINSELRYLEHNYRGTLQTEYLDHDRITGERRSSYTFNHQHNFGRGLTGTLDFNGVSDDSYFADLSSRMTNIAQNNLLRQGALSYATSWWSLNLLVQSFQTLQDPALPPVAVPYRRLPQLSFNATRADLPLGEQDALLSIRAAYTHFKHPTQIEGTRTVINPQLSLPLQSAGLYLTPRLGVHATRYQLDSPTTAGRQDASRTVPLFSLDGGAIFERPTTLFERSFTQTLEPRLYYLRVPVREQNDLPLFDTGLADFNFAQIFADNRYTGDDRISDANQLTAALTTRFINPDNGAELMRAAIAQRYHFSDQRVSLPGELPRSSNTADFLVAVSGRLSPVVSLDANLQYDPQQSQIERLALGSRYQPAIGRVLSASYRYNRNPVNWQSDVKQVDIAAQWPLWNSWSGVGRYNYSLDDHRIIEAIGGLEYNAGCWASRVVLQRIATATGESRTAFFIQLELNGFSNIGSNPMDLLKRSIPGYGRLTQPASDTAFAAF